jgi:hypothetical protein
VQWHGQRSRVDLRQISQLKARIVPGRWHRASRLAPRHRPVVCTTTVALYGMARMCFLLANAPASWRARFAT